MPTKKGKVTKRSTKKSTCKSKAKPKVQFYVVTDNGEKWGGCYYDDYFEPEHVLLPAPATEDIPLSRFVKKGTLIHVKVPAFDVGEIVIIDTPYCREGQWGRKPHKWNIGFEVYDTLDKALRRRDVILSTSTLENMELPPPEDKPIDVQRVWKGEDYVLPNETDRIPTAELLKIPGIQKMFDTLQALDRGIERSKMDRR